MTLHTVMIMAGGTGGHVFPALAVAKKLQQAGHQIVWVGTEKGIESRLVPEAAIPLKTIAVSGLRGKRLSGWLSAPFRLLKAIQQARKIIQTTSPRLVIGFGGFVSGPGGVAAWLSSVPLLIHEQNAIPGLTNRLLSYLAKQVLTGFPNSIMHKKAIWVGNPVREAMHAQHAQHAQHDSVTPYNILVIGGSLGARKLNQLLPEALANIQQQLPIHVQHQSGQQHYSTCQHIYQQQQVIAEVHPFIDDMAAAYQWADVVICRAGALTVAEVAAVGVAAIFIPYPYAVDDHQTHNASYLVEKGAGVLIQEAELSVVHLADTIYTLLTDKSVRLKMASTARQLAKSNATEEIIAICLEELI
ncbi:MAG TPA: undecaprenyldiphospho-muramoylpentapeptide beta-N-acetylglucosaminyltransferase [Gammaproteobacteria bacterium]|nr:undecaprenyldiphospho-muramoylpentapeptide beta-N-acetylglucosaminyltransferase [Gammaproteobacteria bacterium]